MKSVIAIIDDGINEKLYNSGNLLHNTEITPGLEIFKRVDYDPYLPSHGTTCAAIIKKYAPSAVLSSVKILNDEAKGVREQLIKAIQWCVENHIRLVNLSLGTIDYRDFDEIRKVVNYAYHKGLIIVAACNNKDIFTCPASLSNVIGVNCDKNNRLKKTEYVYNHYAPDGVELTACGRHTLIKYTGKKLITSPSNSFAAPLVTALAYNLLINSPGITLEEIKEELRIRAINYSGENYRPFLYKNIDWVDKAVVFNLGRANNQPCQMRYSFGMGKMININCGCIDEGLDRIKDFIRENTDNMIDADTVIVAVNNAGQTHSAMKVDKFLAEISKRGKNVVYLNDQWSENEIDIETSDINMKIWHPMVSKYFNTGPKSKVEIDVPVIGVYDFTGKWLINIAGNLADCFKQEGYNTIVCPDTCSGVIAGFEYTPLNFCTDDIEQSWLKCIYSVYDPDVILLGIDAGGNTGEYLKNLEQSLEIDVKIALFENNGGNLGEIIVDEEKKEISLNLAVGGVDNSPDGLTEVIMQLEKECLPELYRRLLNLFEQ